MTTVASARPAHFAVFSDGIATSSTSINKKQQHYLPQPHAASQTSLFHSQQGVTSSLASHGICRSEPNSHKSSLTIYNDDAEANKENIGGLTQKLNAKGKGKGICVVNDRYTALTYCQPLGSKDITSTIKSNYSKRARQSTRSVHDGQTVDCKSSPIRTVDLWAGRRPFELASPQSKLQSKAAGRAPTIYELPAATLASAPTTTTALPPTALPHATGIPQYAHPTHVSRPNKTAAGARLARHLQQRDVERRVRELTESPLADVTQAYTARGTFCNSPLSQNKIITSSKNANVARKDSVIVVDADFISAPSKTDAFSMTAEVAAVSMGPTPSTSNFQASKPIFVPYTGRINKPVRAMRA